MTSQKTIGSLPRMIAAVFDKEWRDGLRDRRAAASGMLYALAGPLFLALVLGVMARGQEQEAPRGVAVMGQEHAPSLMAELERGGLVAVASEDPAAAVREGTMAVGLIVEAEYAENVRGGRRASVQVIYDGSRSPSRAARRALEARLTAWADAQTAARLVARGVSPLVASPLRIQRADLATSRQRQALTLGAMPLFLVIAAFYCGMHLAIDATAGERERGSLEPLLLTAASPTALATGKWLAAAALNAIGVAATVGVTFVLLRSGFLDLPGMRVDLTWSDGAAMLAVLLPLALLVPAVQLLLALRARSFKEAQTQLSLLVMLPMVPGFLIVFDTLEMPAWIRSLPVVGQNQVLLDIVRGEAWWNAATFGGAVATLVATGFCLLEVSHLLRREAIVFGR